MEREDKAIFAGSFWTIDRVPHLFENSMINLAAVYLIRLWLEGFWKVGTQILKGSFY
jgi:hypothetical protein